MVTLFTSNHCVVHLWLHICHLCSPVSAFSAGNVSENVLSLLIVLPLLKMAQMSTEVNKAVSSRVGSFLNDY